MRISSCQHGASTLEVIAAITIFALAVAGLSITLPMAYKRANQWNLQFRMARVLEEQLEDMRIAAFDDVNVGDTGWINGGDLEVRRVTNHVAQGTTASGDPTWLELAGSGDGLLATYYNNPDFTGTSFQRIDPNIDFSWGLSSPHSSIDSNTFSVRWTGYLLVPTTGTYTFFTRTDDGVRLWVNNRLLISQWEAPFSSEYSGSIPLTGGSMVPITMEMYENTQTAWAYLLWQGPSIAKQVIPGNRFYSSLTKMTLVTVRSTAGTPSLSGRVMHFPSLQKPPVSCDLELTFQNRSTKIDTNTLSPWYRLVNTGDTPIDLTDLTLRYYYTVDGERSQNYYCDHAGILSGNSYQAVTHWVSGRAVRINPSVTNADYYVEISFSQGILPAGASMEIQGRIWKSDWTDYNQSNDYSFAAASKNDYFTWEKVTAYKDGQLIWGTEP